MSSKSPQPLIHIDAANVCCVKIDDALKRSLVSKILAEIEQFYGVNPSGLEAPCDLAFVCKALDYDLTNILDLLRGIVDEGLYWSDELPTLTVAPIDPERDNTEHARRIIPAENYCARHSDKWMAAVLMSVLSVAGIMIRLMGPNHRYNPGRNGPRVVAALPAEPLDYLFLVRALDYAFRPDGPVRRMTQVHDPSHANCQPERNKRD
jgi:hypothetical protein